MNPKDFENYVEKIFIDEGYTTEQTPYQDEGADIFLHKGEKKVVVQVKKYINRAINGQISAKEAMNNIAYEQDKIMGSLKLARYSPKLNPKRTQAYWLAQPGSPKPAQAREKPSTLSYDTAIKRWRKAPQ